MAIPPQEIENRLDEEAGYAVLDQAMNNTPAPENPELLAAVGGRLGAILGRSGRKVLQRSKTLATERAKGLTPEAVEAMRERLLKQYGPDEKITPQKAMQMQEEFEGIDPRQLEKRDEKRVNIHRHAEGAAADEKTVQEMMFDPNAAIQKMENADQMAALLDVVGHHAVGPESTPRTHDSLAAATDTVQDTLKVLQPVLSGKQKGLLNDTQLLGLRRMLTTVGEDAVGMANEITAARKMGQEPSADLLMKYAETLETFQSLQSFAKGQAREVARALAQQRMIAESIKTSGIKSTIAAADSFGGINNLYKHAELTAKVGIDDETKLISEMSKKVGKLFRTGIGVVAELFKASILSGPQTHAVNTSSNTATNIYENMLVRGVAATVGMGRLMASKVPGATKVPGLKQLIGDPADRVSYTEYAAGFTSGMAGIFDGLAGATETIVTGQSRFSEMSRFTTDKVESQGMVEALGEAAGAKLGAAAAGRRAGAAITFSLRALTAEDEFFKSVAFRQELTRLAIRDGIKKGKKGKELTAHANQVMDDPERFGVLDAALDHARLVTFTDQNMPGFLGFIADSTRRAAQRWPVLQFVVPFINTPTNLVRYALDTTGLPVTERMRNMYAAGGAQRDIAIAKTTLGMGATVGAYMWYDQGMLTGAGPKDPAERALWEKAGWAPSSIKINGKWYSYDRTDPFGTVLGGIADAMDRAKTSNKQDAFQKYFMTGVFTIADHTFNATYMKGLNDLFRVLEGRMAPEQLISATGQAILTPYSAMRRTAVKAQRGAERISKDEIVGGFDQIWDQRSRQANPWLEEEDWLRPARFWDAEAVIPRPGEVGYEASGELVAFGFSPIQIRKAREDNVSAELMYNGVVIGEPPTIFTAPGGGGQISMLGLDNGLGRMYDEYFKVAGPLRRERLTALFESNSYRRAADEDAAFRGEDSEATGLIRSTIAKADKDARLIFFRDKLPELIAEGADVSDTARAIAETPDTLWEEFAKREIKEEDYSGIKIKGTGTGAYMPKQVKPPQPAGPTF